MNASTNSRCNLAPVSRNRSGAEGADPGLRSRLVRGLAKSSTPLAVGCALAASAAVMAGGPSFPTTPDFPIAPADIVTLVKSGFTTVLPLVFALAIAVGFCFLGMKWLGFGKRG